LEPSRRKKRSAFYEVWKKLRKNAIAVAALAVIVVLCLTAVFADFIADYENVAIKGVPSERLRSPSVEHIFGTDAMGRDIFARIIHGSRISLQIGLYSTLLSVVGGMIVGSIAGFYGGRVDNVLMRISDVFMSVPSLLLALAIVAALGQGISNLVISLSVAQIPAFGRLMRSQILTIRDNEFVEAARALGASDLRIILLYLLPNAVGPIIVQATISIATAIIAAAALSYIGLGVPPPAPEWGTMLAEGRQYMRQHLYMLLTPGLAIVITALSFNLLGDGLRDALDPRLRGNK
jgi:peptide/nickel transport system permease protein